MASAKKSNNSIYIDREALATLSMAKEGILDPVDKLMNEKEAKSVDATGLYRDRTCPFSFVLAPAGKRNNEVLKKAKPGEKLSLFVEGKKIGHITIEEIFKIDKIKRVEKIFGTSDETHPGAMDALKRLGNYAISGKYKIDFDDIKKTKEQIKRAKEQIGAKDITAIMMAAKPLHRAHEKLIRQSLEKSDLLILFLLKPYKQDMFSYSLRYKTLKFFVDNFLPKNRVLIVPFENTYIFAGYNNVILDSIAAKNFGCTKLIIGQNHSGIGMYYDKNILHSSLDIFRNLEIDIEMISEYVYCDECKTLVGMNSCPHGKHHQIMYRSESILEIVKQGLLPPAVLIRKEISAILLSELFPNRFKNLSQIYDDLIPCSGLLESHNEKDFYLELIKMHQTASLT